ncbi:hypothetical protein DFS33DRAFT_1383482 [Desarmillaria ectypa]|nr:hypothetical protein DFS33DRAFT_1383482 [Desarmillaria ectypa]
MRMSRGSWNTPYDNYSDWRSHEKSRWGGMPNYDMLTYDTGYYSGQEYAQPQYENIPDYPPNTLVARPKPLPDSPPCSQACQQGYHPYQGGSLLFAGAGEDMMTDTESAGPTDTPSTCSHLDFAIL